MSVVKLGGALPLNQQPTPADNDKRLHEVAKLYENQFMREMLKAMRDTVPEGGMTKPSQTENIFKEQLDGEYSNQWSEKGGLGLADIIYKQLIDKYGPAMGLKNPPTKPKGPLSLVETNKFTGREVPTTASNKVTYRFDRNPEIQASLKNPGLGGGLSENLIGAPWDGVITESKKLGADEHLLRLQHANGLQSQLVFRGLEAPGLRQTSLQAGQTIGILSPDAKSFFWSIENRPKSE